MSGNDRRTGSPRFWIPTVRAGVNAVAASAGEILVRQEWQSIVFRDLDVDDLRTMLAHVDGSRDAATIAKALSNHFDYEDVVNILAQLVGSVLDDNESVHPTSGRRHETDDDTNVDIDQGTRNAPITIVGNGRLGLAVQQDLAVHGFSRCHYLEAHIFHSCLDPEFDTRRRRAVVLPIEASQSGSPHKEAGVTVSRLTQLLAQQAIVICALEGLPYRACADVAAACATCRVPVLFLEPHDSDLLVGPTVIPGRTTCFQCMHTRMSSGSSMSNAAVRSLLDFFTSGVARSDAVGVLSALAAEHIRRELVAISRNQPRARTLGGAVRVRPGLAATVLGPFAPLGDCERCHVQYANISTAAELSATLSACEIRMSPTTGPPPPDDRLSVGVIGGGTAGYFAALAIKARYPEFDVSLVESSDIPIIGVGEATTPAIRSFLHRDLGFDVSAFYARVRPTWKLGIKFIWGDPADASFNYPFGANAPYECLRNTGDMNSSSLESLLMSRDLAPMVSNDAGGYSSLLSRVSHAYHLDNKRLVHFLREEAPRREIACLDETVTDVVLKDGGEEVDQLVTGGGRRLRFDVYVDCTGFRSLLMERALKSPFHSFARTLFTDTAVVANVPHHGLLKPYTLAESMHHGWCWNISTREEDHRGYVFASQFCSLDQAVMEMRQQNPEMGEPHLTVKFRAGRHEHFWKGNVVAVGNAYGFVEPLESTAIHMMIFEIRQLLDTFPTSKRGWSAQSRRSEKVNLRVGRNWDYLRWFLGLHYKFNRKFSTPFWTACREDIDVSGAEELIEEFRARGPLSYQRRGAMPALVDDELFGLPGIDALLLGQRVPTRGLTSLSGVRDWGRFQRAITSVVAKAVPQREALEAIDRQPALLD